MQHNSAVSSCAFGRASGRTFGLLFTMLLALVLAAGCAHRPEESTSYPPARSRIEYDSQQLLMKNAEQVSDIIKRKMKKAQDIQASQEDNDDAGIQAEPGAIRYLQDALRIILSRPDQDGARSNIVSVLRRELSDLNSYEGVLQGLTQEAISTLKADESPIREQGTYVVLLENLIAELKPDLNASPLSKKLIEDIRDADIAISERLQRQQFLSTMSKPVSPSETAAKVLPKPKENEKSKKKK